MGKTVVLTQAGEQLLVHRRVVTPVDRGQTFLKEAAVAVLVSRLTQGIRLGLFLRPAVGAARAAEKQRPEN